MSDPIPAHIQVTDQMVRKLRADCGICQARVDVGQYLEDPQRPDQVLAEWIRRHQHKETP
jgi:hypothetical protein